MFWWPLTEFIRTPSAPKSPPQEASFSEDLSGFPCVVALCLTDGRAPVEAFVDELADWRRGGGQQEVFDMAVSSNRNVLLDYILITLCCVGTAVVIVPNEQKDGGRVP